MNGERVADRILRFWPVYVVLATAVSGWLKLKWDVDDIIRNQERWQSGASERREKAHDEMDSIRIRLAVLEDRMARSNGK